MDFISLLSFVILVIPNQILAQDSGDDELGMRVEDIIRKYGYPVEFHDVITEDGYNLSTIRIPHGKDGENARGRHGEPVLLSHAFISSATAYFVLTPHSVLPFMYADAGFDVWLGNFRGNAFSTHLNYSLSDSRYWNFTLDDVALYDIPAQIDYILEHTQKEKLVYYGYSMGGGIILQTLALRPEYSTKVRRMTIVANSGFYCKSRSPVLNNGFSIQGLERFYDGFFNGRFVTSQFASRIIPGLCFVFRRLCFSVIELLGDVNTGQISLKTLRRMLYTFPDYTSVKFYIQLLQWCRSGPLARYDYGRSGNLAEYGSPTPPTYNYSSVTVPMCALFGFRDGVVPLKDAVHSMGNLPNWCNRNNPLIETNNWGHLDSMYGDDAGKMVFSRSIKFHLQDESVCSC